MNLHLVKGDVMDEETRKTLCRVIAGIVVADDHLDAREARFLDRLLERFGLDTDARDCFYPIMGAQEAANELRGMNWSVQEEAFGLLIEAAAADKEYGEEERAYLHAVAEVLGVSKDEVDLRVDRTIATSAP